MAADHEKVLKSIRDRIRDGYAAGPHTQAQKIAAIDAALAALRAEAGAVGDRCFTYRELVQAATQHYKNQTGDDRHVPATIMAVETVSAFATIIQEIRSATSLPIGASE